MSNVPAVGFEQYWRQTLPSTLAEDPAVLFDYCVVASYTARTLAYHYDNKLVTAVAPVWDDGHCSDFGEPKLKLLSAGNFKPVEESAEDAAYTRVCAEQNLIDNALRVGDTLMSAMFVRASNNITSIEGTKAGEAIQMCKPCRGRSSFYLDPELIVVSLRGDDMVPVEASTIQQQINEQEFGYPHEVLAAGDEVRDVVVEAFKSGTHKKIGRLPERPARRYRRRTDT